MTDPRPNVRRAGPPRDPYGIGPVSGYVGPALAVVALVVIASITIGLFNGQLPFQKTGGNDTTNGDGGGADITPAPSNKVITPPALTFPGSIAYAKAGNIWIQTAGGGATQITDGGTDSMPAFSADGSWVYFIRVDNGAGKFPNGGYGARSWYDLSTPMLMRVKPDGTGAQRLLTGRYQQGGSTWFSWMREPTPTPDGKTVILITDGPNPLQSDIVVKSYNLTTKQLTSLHLPESGSLGHQDPAWRSDGRILLYVRNAREVNRGAPQVYKYDPKSGKTSPLTGPGYLSPAFSPDGQFIAATRTDSFGTDVAILDSGGKEILRVTDDGHSFSPVWSPAGDAVAYLHLAGTIVDLKLARLDPSSGRWAVTTTLDLTKVSGLDGASRPSWYAAASELPTPSVVPSQPADSGPGASASAAP